MPLSQIFLGSSQKRLLRTGVPILAYHYFGAAPAASPDPYLYISGKSLNHQLRALRDIGYSSASLSEVASACQQNRVLTGKVAITIDDGAKNFFEGGMSSLNEHGFRAIQFLVAGQIGGVNDWDAKHGHPLVPLMDSGQIREWLAEGHEIGSHSMTHRNLSNLGEPEARRQILDSKKKLEDLFGIPIRHFCYPHGRANAISEALVEEAGYETACTTRFGVNGPGQNLNALHRIFPLSITDLLGKIGHRLCRKVGFNPMNILKSSMP